jgi:hypothetical protein
MRLQSGESFAAARAVESAQFLRPSRPGTVARRTAKWIFQTKRRVPCVEMTGRNGVIERLRQKLRLMEGVFRGRIIFGAVGEGVLASR